MATFLFRGRNRHGSSSLNEVCHKELYPAATQLLLLFGLISVMSKNGLGIYCVSSGYVKKAKLCFFLILKLH